MFGLDLRQLEQCRENILKPAEVVTDFFRWYVPRPTRDERYTEPAFVQVAFHAAQRAVAVEELHLMPSLLMRAVVTGKHHDRVVVDFVFLQHVQDSADVLVDVVDHARESFFLIRDVEIGMATPVRYAHAVVLARGQSRQPHLRPQHRAPNRQPVGVPQ